MSRTHDDPTDIQREKRADANKRREQELRRGVEADDVRWLMGSKRGRRMVHRLLDWAGVYRSSFSPNALEMAHREGHRNYGCTMLALITAHCPELYVTLLKEHRVSSDGSASRAIDNQS